MKRIRIGTLALLALVVTVGVTMVIRAALAQRPKLTAQEGHWSPLSIKVTYRDGKTRTTLLVGTNRSPGGIDETHSLTGIGEGNSNVRVWLDTVRMIKGTNDKEFTVVYADGTTRDFEYGTRLLDVANPDDSVEVIPLANIKTVEIVKPARKDKKDNAMFDHWKYSPFTGEKLSDE